MSVLNPFSKLYIPKRPTIITPPPPPVLARKWNPGNYIGMSGEIATHWNVTGANPGVLQRLAADTTGKFEGAQIRIHWKDLEPTKDNYNFSAIKKCLSDMAPHKGNKLVVLFHVKTFGASSLAVPAYMRTSAYADPDFPGNADYYGCYPYASSIGGPGGYVVSMHLVSVRERFKALMDALAAELDNHENFEAFCITEDSINKPINAVMTGAGDWNRVYTWFSNMTNAWAFARSQFTRTLLLQWINADRKYMSTNTGGVLSGYVPDIVDIGIGLGMPDGCMNDLGFQIEGTHPGNIYLCNFGASESVPIMVNMSGPATLGSVANPQQASPTFPGPGVSRQAGQDWARNTVKATHVIWMHMPGTYNATFNAQNGAVTAQPASDSISGDYLGKYINKVTDDWIKHASSNILTRTNRPTGW